MCNMYEPKSGKDVEIWFESILQTLQADAAIGLKAEKPIFGGKSTAAA